MPTSTRYGFQSTPTNFMAGDACSSETGAWLLQFQSTPTNFMAGDTAELLMSLGCSSFNPRPPISWRATICSHDQRRCYHRRFNPRPPISWRATLKNLTDSGGYAVSIHAHQFHGGRRQPGLFTANTDLRQTARLTEAEGARRRCHG